MLEKQLKKIRLKNAVLKKCKDLIPEIQDFVAERKVIVFCSDAFLKDIMVEICHKCKLTVESSMKKKETEEYCYFYLENDVKNFYGQLLKNEDIYLKIYEILEIINYCIIENKQVSDYFSLLSRNHEIIIGYKNYLYPEQLNIQQIDFMITERCSLKCSECLNLMQYYENPRDIEIEVLKNSLDIIDSIFDELKELRILGGEPFMNRQIYEIIDYATKLKNIKNIVVFSNGTIIPEKNKLEVIKEKQKVIFYFSQYGVENQKSAQSKKILCDIGFNCCVADFSKSAWIKHSAFKANNLDKENINSLFINCTGKTCPTILDNKLYICEYAANAIRLGAVPRVESDYVNLTEGENTKNKVKDYLERLEAITPCHFCTRLFHDKNSVELVEPGIQLKTALKYEKI